MTRYLLAPVVAALLVGPTTPSHAAEKGAGKVPAALNYRMKSLAGKEVDLSKYLGKVVMVVNVASKCGLTPQYEQLQALHEKSLPKGGSTACWGIHRGRRWNSATRSSLQKPVLALLPQRVAHIGKGLLMN